MVHRLVVSFGQPDDPSAFEMYRENTHLPLVQRLPGLLRLTVGHVRPLDPTRTAPYLVAELDFGSEQAMVQALASPEGRSAGADLANFATGGAALSHLEVHVLIDNVDP